MSVILLEELAARLPSDCEERVLQAKNEFNQITKNLLIKETSLRMRGKSLEHDDAQIAVKVKPGFPVAFERFLRRTSSDNLDAIISLYENDLRDLLANATEVERLVEKLSHIDPGLPECGDNFKAALGESKELASRLLERISNSYLQKLIFSIQDDILGIYKPFETKGEVELYWTAIGVGAKLLNVRIEELTAVVLIHELAHGFTHLGKDADDESWGMELMFRQVDRAIVEGVAQYYTDVISEQLGDTKAIGIHEAYLKLRRLQRGYYRVHDRWVENYTSEVVRSALLEFRRKKRTSRPDFERMLGEASDRLHATPKDRHERVIEDLRRNGPLSEEYDDLVDGVLVQASEGRLRFSDQSDFFLSLQRAWAISGDLQAATAVSEWNLALATEFRKSTDSLDRGLKGRLFDAMQDIVGAPLKPRGDTVKRLTGDFEGLWRYRIGDYRVLYRVDKMAKQIVFLRCESRSSVYDS